MQIRVIQSFATAHGSTPRGSVITVPDDLGSTYVADGIAVAVEPVPQREVAVAPASRTRTKAVRQTPINEI